jgi:sugar transferase (PEP-CTERM/EpsH1 system associated)
MEILYVAHCVPWPPDKGDRIRAHHTIRELVKRHRVHVACFTRNARDTLATHELHSRLASFHVEVLNLPRAFARGLLELARGGSLTVGFHRNTRLLAHLRSVLAFNPIDAVVLISSSSAAYVPDGVPFLADWGDVDSEKRLQYAAMRHPGFPHRLEGQRLRRIERDVALRAQRTFLTTKPELELFRKIAPAAAACCGNGVDTEYFDASAVTALPALAGRRFIAFVGVMNYFPNTDAANWFATEVFPALRRRDPALELLLVGRNPTRGITRLGRQPGISVTGEVADVRPYLAGAHGVIAPLRMARGIQNKVLEALAMGKRVLASDPVWRAFAPDFPPGLVRCAGADDYLQAVADLPMGPEADPAIVQATRARFSWSAALAPLMAELERLEHGAAGQPQVQMV